MKFDNDSYFNLAASLIKQQRHKELAGCLATNRDILINYRKKLLKIAADERNKQAQELLQKQGIIQTSQKPQLTAIHKKSCAQHAAQSFDAAADKPESIYSVHSTRLNKTASSQSSSESISSFSSPTNGIGKQHKMPSSPQLGKLKLLPSGQAPRTLFASLSQQHPHSPSKGKLKVVAANQAPQVLFP